MHFATQRNPYIKKSGLSIYNDGGCPRAGTMSFGTFDVHRVKLVQLVVVLAR